VEYITDNSTKEYVRDLAREILIKKPSSVEQVIEQIRENDRTFEHSI
jgi:hypothetical protein